VSRVLRWGGVLLLLLLLVPAFVIVALEEKRAEAAIPSDFALSDIPVELLPVYGTAARDTCEMPWEVLAAVGNIESSHGRSDAPGVKSGTNSAGAAGPMQFMPRTWEAYRVDGDRDGDTDIYDPVDSIWSAANVLCANGAGDGSEDRIRDALFAYNHSGQYVEEVLVVAARYRAAGAGIGQGADASALLANPNLVLTAQARRDLESGVISQRIVDFLAWSVQSHRISVTVLKSGHSEFVRGTDRRSNHFFGRGADIFTVDGQAVRDSCRPCRTYAEEIAALSSGRPDETGTPWSDMSGVPGFFNNSDHEDHIHAGYDS
jgi:hypothetical protein